MRRRARRLGPWAHLHDASDVLLLVSPGADGEWARRSGLPASAEMQPLTSPVPRPRSRDAVVLLVRDLVSLRRAVTGVANVGAARRVAVWFERDGVRLPSIAQDPQWPALESVVGDSASDGFIVLGFASETQVRPVLMGIARACAPSGRLAVAWPALGACRDDPAHWPVADPSAKIALLPRLLDEAVDSPPDLVLLGPEAVERADMPRADHPVLGRPSRLAVMEPDLTWEQWEAMPAGEAEEALDRRGPLSLGAVDDQLVNPIGFDRDATGPVVPLEAGRDGGLSLKSGGPAPVAVDALCGVSDVDLPALRGLRGVRLDWAGGRGPQAYARAVAGLGAAGVPLVTDRVPDWARSLLAPALAEALAQPVDLDDRLHREEHSVRSRRASLRSHGAAPWRRALAASHDLQPAPAPSVSVLLATRRPDMLGFALRQVARQRGVQLELVLATHGFTADPATLDGFRAACPALTVLEVDASRPFGEVLNLAAARASGDLLLKMDDDDWYGPDFAGDLVLARGYSGAEVVGCPPEFTFLQPIWLTTRDTTTTEVYRPFVAGGTLLIERDLFRALGGFRHTVRYVDANLLSAVSSAGARTYRTHGLGYVLRRTAAGHTWDPGLDYFLKPGRVRDQWRGLRPSALLDLQEADRPSTPGR